MILYCMRHGHAEHNANDIMNGNPSKQFKLTKLGRGQVIKGKEKIKDVQLDVVITSEFPRAIETAKIVSAGLDIPTIQDKRLNDIKSGVEGKSYFEYKEQQKIAAEIQGTDVSHARINDGESFEDEKKRVYSFLDWLKNQNYENVLISAHFDTVVIINYYINNLTNEEGHLFKPQKGQIYKFSL